ncbi:unnamed protein product [Pieris brassicae]|uniref:FAD-binding FR-type domain-containing protein n=1 Tax=Pieris brassicae TaxID=7116 RepID=A0A9P0SJK0_PIEBR|nr:unnamed protein product [Pieris brassicae]
MARFINIGCVYLKQRFFLISWISLVIYLFYKTFIYYYNSRQFYYLRQILGVGLCLSRGTATVLNVCCAIILLPLCKKMNQKLYRLFSKLCPGLFFLWLEKAKSFHMTVGITLVIFGVTHSVSHFVNLWNFSRNFDEERIEINLARYKNENPLNLLMSLAGVTGLSMLLIIISMGVTSTRVVRRRLYNAFWYTHHLYLPFMALLMIHPISGVLKEEILDSSLGTSHMFENNETLLYYVPQFRAIKPKTWLWMALPLTCYFLDLFWRIFARNLSKVDIVKVRHMPGRTISLSLRSHQNLSCRIGQYVLVQCADVSMIEWHPFTVVKIPTTEKVFELWIKVKGDWTEALEKVLLEQEHDKISVLIDGPFSSPMEGVCKSEIAICVAAGVGITPFVAMLDNLCRNPRSRNPGRIHLIWIVRTEQEIAKLVELANKCISELRDANRPDRLHLEVYVTHSKTIATHTIQINKRGDLTHILKRDKLCEEEKSLLTPKYKRHTLIDVKIHKDFVKKPQNYEDALLKPIDKRNKIDIKMSNGEINIKIDGKRDLIKDYPLVACRIRRGRPYWDRVFGFWVHLYPGHHINLFCCGPKNLVNLLRNKCKNTSLNTKTKLTFIHEAFS